MSQRPQIAKLYGESEESKKIKYKSQIVTEDLTLKFQKTPGQKLRIFSDGVYDCMHYGHLNQLKQIKEMFPDCHLIVGVSCQKAVEANKGPTLMTPEERVEGVKACKWADEIYYPCPWVLTKEFLEELNIDVVCHDSAPYGYAGGEDMYATCKELGKFQATQRTEGVSTSDIIMNVLVNREFFIIQQLLEGRSRQDLNLSLYYYTKLMIKYNLQKLFCPRKNKSIVQTEKTR